jgi:hypothetical protein
VRQCADLPLFGWEVEVSEPTVSEQVIIWNNGNSPITMVVEPWADECLIAPGERWHVTFLGAQGPVEVCHEPSRVLVFGLVGSTYEAVRVEQE